MLDGLFFGAGYATALRAAQIQQDAAAAARGTLLSAAEAQLRQLEIASRMTQHPALAKCDYCGNHQTLGDRCDGCGANLRRTR